MRSEQIEHWLSETGWGDWQRVPLACDASARRYERLTDPTGRTVILMDAPPATCGSQSAFVAIAEHLQAVGLAAPEILNWDDALGLMVLSDLGSNDFAKHLRHTPNDERELYLAACDVLIALTENPPPTGLTTMTPEVGADMIDLAFEWAATDKSRDLASEIKDRVQRLLEGLEPTRAVLSLRDFHAENLIWRPDQHGVHRVGLLDFQDAFIAHPIYDLASLVRDVRRDVDPAVLPVLIKHMAGPLGDDASLKHAFHVIAVQRNLRILGVFNRLAHQDNKTGYLALLPRVRAHLETDLSEGGFDDLAPLIRRAFDPKEHAT